MHFFQALASNPLVHSIGWTLLHACWQIILVALFIKILMVPAEKKSANLAYTIAVFGLVLISGWSIYTFVDQYQHFAKAIEFAPIEMERQNNNQLVVATRSGQYTEPAITESKGQEKNWTEWIQQFERYLPILVVLWLLGASLLVIRFIAAWLNIRRLKTRGLQEVEAHWQKRFENLKQKIGLQKSIGFYFSSLVKEPVTMGHFKPIVLIPLGMFANLSPDMVETVLLHELAHIKRSDYLINIVQSLVEIIFFFHPGVWWISRKIRQSREHACDDIAVNACNDAMLYAKTLTTIQSSYLSSKNNLAMSSSGKSGNFTTRIKRLFGYTESPAYGKRSILFASLIFTCLIAFAFTQPFEQDQKNNFYPETWSDSEAMLFVITPSTTQKQLDKIVNAFAKENITLDFYRPSFTQFGLLEAVEFSFTMPDNSTKNFDVKQLAHITITLDWNRPQPLDVRPNGQHLDFSYLDQKEPENMADMPRPYTNTYHVPAMIGELGFKRDNNNRDLLEINPASNLVLLLNGKPISRSDLLAKELGPKEVTAINRLSAAQYQQKYQQTAAAGAYEIYAKLDQSGNKWWPFKKDKDAHLKVHTFKVLHKAEVRGINRKDQIGIEGGPITISADNCNDTDKAFHVFNDQIMETPEDHCYPPQILALTEVDSFFILEAELAAKLYGNIGNKGAYVYYYQAKVATTEIDEAEEEGDGFEITESDLAEPLDIADEYDITEGDFPDGEDVADEYDITEADTSEPIDLADEYDLEEDAAAAEPKMEATLSHAIINGDEVTMYNVQFNVNCENDDPPLCFFNNERLGKLTSGQWPKVISAYERFDSIKIISGETAIQTYGEAGKSDVWFFYKNTNKQSFPEKVLKTESDQKYPAMLYVLNGQLLFPEPGNKVPSQIEKLERDEIKHLRMLTEKDATDKYGEVAKNGVIEVETESSIFLTMLEKDFFKVSPNPVYEVANVDFIVYKTTPVKILVYNSNGQLLSTLANRTMDKGQHHLQWEPGQIANGIYYIQLQMEGEVFTKSVILQKGM